MTLTVRIIERSLSDGSLVYDVRLPYASEWLPAVTHDDALQLAEKVTAAINEHTNEEVTVAFASDVHHSLRTP